MSNAWNSANSGGRHADEAETPAGSTAQLNEFPDGGSSFGGSSIGGYSRAGNLSRHRRLQRQLVIKSSLTRQNVLMAVMVVSIILAIAVGLSLRQLRPSRSTIQLVAFPGDLLMQMLKMLILPLIVSSVIASLSSLDAKACGRMGSLLLVYYFLTTVAAAILGIALVLIVHPGSPGIKQRDQSGEKVRVRQLPKTLDSLLDLLRNLFPENLIEACFTHTATIIMERNVTVRDAITNETRWYTEEESEVTKVSSTNVLGLIAFSMFFGLMISQMGNQAVLMVQFFGIMNDIILRMVRVIMWYSPIGIFFLITSKILSINNLSNTARSLGLYLFTVILGLLIHSCLTLSVSFFVLTRRNPVVFFRGIFQAWITALGTASSAATLPITFRCLEENNGIDKRVTRFVLPIGATVNMDGTALYEAVASIFIAQINGIRLNFVQLIIVCFTATLASIGAVSVPSGGLVTLFMVLSAVGLPTDDISIILTIEWLLDRLRTSVNVLGDAYGAGIVDHFFRAEWQQEEQQKLAADDAWTPPNAEEEGSRGGEEPPRLIHN